MAIGGYLELEVENQTLGGAAANVTPGCPPPTNCVNSGTEQIPIAVGNSIRLSGRVKKCDQIRWTYSALGPHTVNIKTGACGAVGEDITVASTPLYANEYGYADFYTVVTATQAWIDWINRLKAAGKIPTFYAQMDVSGIGWFSAEVRVTAAAIPVCTTGTIEILEYCSDGTTWKRKRTCVNGQWVESSQTCPVPPPAKNGYGILTIINKSTNDTRSTTVTGCPPPTACTSPPIIVSLGQTLRAEVYLYKCDGSYWYHALLGDQTGYIKSGACGDAGEDHTYGSGTVGGLPGTTGLPMTDWAWMQTEFAVSQGMIDWITRQKAAGHRSSLYFNMTVEGYGWYSGEVALDIVITPPPPPVVSCDSIPHGLGADVWSNIAWGFCVALQPAITLFKYVIDNTEWFWGPLVTAIGNIKIEVPPFIFDLEKWFKDFPALVTSWLEWFTNPVGKAFGLAGQVGEGLGDAISQIFKVVDPMADYFNPNRFHTDEVKALVAPIHAVLGQGEFTLAELIGAVVWGDYYNLYEMLQETLVPTGPVDYAEGRVRARNLIRLAGDLAGLCFSIDWLVSVLPRGIRVIDRLANGIRTIAGAAIAVGSIGTVFSPAIDIAIKAPLERQWKTQARPTRPDVGKCLSMRAEGLITKAEYYERLAEQGLPDEWHDKLYSEYLDDVTFRDLTTLWRRGVITRERLDGLLEVARKDPEWLNFWHELLYDDPTFRMLNTMATQGQLTEDQLTTGMNRLGLSEPYKTKLKDTLRDAYGRTERRRVITLFARRVAQDGATEEAYYALADSYKVPHDIASLILEAERLRIASGEDVTEREATKGMFDAWYKVDIVDGGKYTAGLSGLGYDSETITRELARLDKLKEPVVPPVTEREATRAMWDIWYLSDIITPDAWGAAYESLGYDIEIATHQLAYLDKKKAPPIVPPPPPEKATEATRAMYDTFYTEDIIDAATWRAWYEAQKYTTDVITLQLALLDKKKAPPVVPPPELPEERDLLQAEAISAYKKHVIDELTLRDRLDKLGRSQDAIDVLVAVAKADMAVEQRDATLAVYSKAYRQGAILRSDYLAKLIDNQYTPDAAELIIQTEELSWGTGVETLTQTQILNSWELGFLDDEQVQKRLKATGLADTDMHVLLANSVLDQLKAKHLTGPEADKKWSDLGVGPDERAKLLAWYGWTPT